MTVDYSRSPVIDIRKYLINEITNAGIFDSEVPIVPVEQTPETNDDITGPFIVYENMPLSVGGDTYWIMKEEVNFYIYSSKYLDVLALQTLLIDIFRRQDLTATDINTFGNGSPISFLCCYIISSEPPQGAKSENGRFGGSVSIEYDYTRSVSSNGRFAS